MHHECVETGVDLKVRDYAAASVAAEGSDFVKKEILSILSHFLSREKLKHK